MEFRIVRPNGAVAWLESRGQLFVNPDGEPERFAGVTVDVTDRKRIELHQRFLVHFSDQIRPLANPSEVLRVAVSAAGEFLEVSRCFCAEVMIESQEIIVFRNYCHGVDGLDGIYSFSDIKLPIIERLLRGETIVVNDTAADHRVASAFEDFFAPRGVRAFIIVPYIDDCALVWTMAVTTGSEPRTW